MIRIKMAWKRTGNFQKMTDAMKQLESTIACAALVQQGSVN